MKREFLLIDRYTDYLTGNTNLVVATGLSGILNQKISYDRRTRMINSCEGNSKCLWNEVKPTVPKLRNTANSDFLIIDDTAEENQTINFHYLHAEHRYLKGLNIQSVLIRYGEIAILIDCLVKKTVPFVEDNKTKIECFPHV